MTEYTEGRVLIKRKDSVVFKEGYTLGGDFCNLLLLVGVKLGGAVKITLVVLYVCSVGLTANAVGV